MLFPLSIRKSVNFFSPTNDRGVTIIELIVGMLLFVTVSAGIYKAYTTLTKKALETQRQTKEDRNLQQFFERFRHQLENTVQMPNANSTVLRLLKRVPECVALYLDEWEDMGWGLIPYPGVDVLAFNTEFNHLNTVSPLTMLPNGPDDPERQNDGIRLVYVSPDSTLYRLALDELNNFQPYPTVGNNPIIVDRFPDTLTVGDFAVISDARKSDLIRITNISPSGMNPDWFTIEHQSEASIWNIDFIENYGHGVLGGAIIHKVHVATYALDTETNTLMVDNHYFDDNFNGEVLVGPPILAQNWEPAINGVSRFQVIFETVKGLETRTPQPGEPGKLYVSCDALVPTEDCGCENQLGYPDLKDIRLEIILEGES